jgi:hypothetical protein
MVRTEFLLETAIARAISEAVRSRAALKLREVLEHAHARGAGQGQGVARPGPRRPGQAPRLMSILDEEAERAVAAAHRQRIPVRLGALLTALQSRSSDPPNADQALLALVRKAGNRVAVEIDRH